MADLELFVAPEKLLSRGLLTCFLGALANHFRCRLMLQYCNRNCKQLRLKLNRGLKKNQFDVITFAR